MQPKIHDKMLYFPAGYGPGGEPPWPAFVTFVHNDHKVNLAIFDQNGALYPRGRGVILVQSGDAAPPPGTPYCTFAP